LKIFITGRPGIGKTTVFMKIIDNLRNQGYIVGGIVCPEIRAQGKRLGFNMIDLLSNRKGILAYICSEEVVGLRVGKYCINLEDTIEIGSSAIMNALKQADVVGIDEIGPMELKVPQLKSSIYMALRSNKPVLAVVHYRIIEEIKDVVRESRIYEVGYGNRNILPNIISSIILEYLKSGKSGKQTSFSS